MDTRLRRDTDQTKATCVLACLPPTRSSPSPALLSGGELTTAGCLSQAPRSAGSQLGVANKGTCRHLEATG